VGTTTPPPPPPLISLSPLWKDVRKRTLSQHLSRMFTPGSICCQSLVRPPLISFLTSFPPYFSKWLYPFLIEARPISMQHRSRCPTRPDFFPLSGSCFFPIYGIGSPSAPLCFVFFPTDFPYSRSPLAFVASDLGLTLAPFFATFSFNALLQSPPTRLPLSSSLPLVPRRPALGTLV